MRSTPALVVGMPVAFVNSRFNLVMPNALFHENDTPGIVVLFFFAIEERFMPLLFKKSYCEYAPTSEHSLLRLQI